MKVQITDYMHSEESKMDQGNFLQCRYTETSILCLHGPFFSSCFLIFVQKNLNNYRIYSQAFEHDALNTACLKANGDINKAIGIVLGQGTKFQRKPIF